MAVVARGAKQGNGAIAQIPNFGFRYSHFDIRISVFRFRYPDFDIQIPDLSPQLM